MCRSGQPLKRPTELKPHQWFELVLQEVNREVDVVDTRIHGARWMAFDKKSEW